MVSVEDEIENQKVEWIKFAQQSQRDLAEKYNETAKVLIGLFSTIFAIYTVILTFLGLPTSVKIPNIVAIIPIIFFTASLIFLIYIIGPQKNKNSAINFYNPDEIMNLAISRNKSDHRNLTISVLFFVFGIISIPCVIGVGMINPGEKVQILIIEEKVPLLKSVSVPFEGNTSVTSEILLINSNDKVSTIKLQNGNTVALKNEWIQVISVKG